MSCDLETVPERSPVQYPQKNGMAINLTSRLDVDIRLNEDESVCGWHSIGDLGKSDMTGNGPHYADCMRKPTTT